MLKLEKHILVKLMKIIIIISSVLLCACSAHKKNTTTTQQDYGARIYNPRISAYVPIK